MSKNKYAKYGWWNAPSQSVEKWHYHDEDKNVVGLIVKEFDDAETKHAWKCYSPAGFFNEKFLGNAWTFKEAKNRVERAVKSGN